MKTIKKSFHITVDFSCAKKTLYFSTIFFLINLLVSATFGQTKESTQNKNNPVYYESNNSPLPEKLSQEDAISLALKTSRELQSLNTNVQIASYRLNSNGWIDNPELRISDVSTRYYTEQFDELRLGLRWRFPKIGELAEEKQQARVRLWTRKVRALRYRQQLIAKVRRNYADVIMCDELVNLAEKRVTLETERISLIDKMVSLGRRTVVYQTKAKMWNAESKNNLARSVQRKRLERLKLARKTGVSENAKLSVTDLPEVKLELEQLTQIAFQNRPELELVQQREELANKQFSLEYKKLIPWLTFIDLSYHVEDKRGEDWGEMRLGIKLPLFNWNRGNIKATSLAVKRKADESDAKHEEIEDEVRAAYTVYRDYLLDWKNFSQDANELMIGARDLIKNAKKHETLQPDEVLEMDLILIETQTILHKKRRDLAHALIDLYYSMGIEGADLLSQKKDR
jgi:outer membrane protein TolC